MIYKQMSITGKDGRIFSITIDEGAEIIEFSLTKKGGANRGARVRLEKGNFEPADMAGVYEEVERGIDIIFGEEEYE